MRKLPKYNLLLLFIFIQLLNSNEMQSRDFDPQKKNTTAIMRPNTDDPKLNIITFYAGVAGGGKQNTCYFLKSKLTLVDKINFDGAAFFLIHGDRLYNANFSYGNIIAATEGTSIRSIHDPNPDDAI